MDEPGPLRPRQLTPQVFSEVRQATTILEQGPTPFTSSLTSTTSAIQAVSTASITGFNNNNCIDCLFAINPMCLSGNSCAGD